ncbi:MAG TPA: phosphoglucosamine mutase [Fimbriimonas sp.]|nr:phosphoglucosamine mutase [Fimbriimonas sp.]
MSRRWFGTDGVRGVANQRLTPELAFFIGQAAGVWLAGQGGHPRAVIGSDTRRSGPMLGAAVTAGLCSAGIDVNDVGVAPTPTVSFLARTGEFGLGVIVSASHNPAPDNGVKFVGHDGRKLPDASEEEIEARMERPFSRPTGGDVGGIERDRSGIESYLQFLQGLLPERLEGWHIAVDCANGAAFELGPEILRRLGAKLSLIGVQPDGVNINSECGATKPETVGKFTADVGAQIGVAFDGDADRAVFCDEQGRLINGDRTMGIWAAHRKRRGELNPPVTVGTVMSNGGFEAYLTAQGVKLERAPVGDKYVAQRIEETKALVGGEQSGHIIFPQNGPTGDGLATALELLRVLRVEGKKASEYLDAYEPWPQLLVNVGVESTEGWRDKVAEELAESERMIGSLGRVVVRPSGTQPMIRVMVEAKEYDVRDKAAEAIVAAMEKRLNGHVHGRVDLTYALGD